MGDSMAEDIERLEARRPPSSDLRSPHSLPRQPFQGSDLDSHPNQIPGTLPFVPFVTFVTFCSNSYLCFLLVQTPQQCHSDLSPMVPLWFPMVPRHLGLILATRIAPYGPHPVILFRNSLVHQKEPVVRPRTTLLNRDDHPSRWWDRYYIRIGRADANFVPCAGKAIAVIAVKRIK